MLKIIPEPIMFLAKRPGYQFRGWYTKKKGGQRIYARTLVSDIETRKLYAHWKVITYTITYGYNKGKLKAGKSNPETYKVTSPAMKLAKPTRKGYVFQGWYTEKEDGAGKKMNRIPAGTTGDLTLYARFKPAVYTIAFDSNGVLKNTVASIQVQYGKKVTLPTPAEAAFISWNTSSDCTGKKYQGGDRVKNLSSKNGAVVTLYANPFIDGNNIRKLYDYFQRNGFTKEASAAIVGNLMYESGGGYSDVKLNAVEYSTGRGIGMCQWTNTADMSRRTNFENYCESQGKPWPNQDLKVQVDFLMAEMEGKKYGKVWYFLPSQGYPAAYEMSLKKFRKLTNVGTAVTVFCANFERPLPQHANLQTRTDFAVYVMNNN